MVRLETTTDTPLTEAKNVAGDKTSSQTEIQIEVQTDGISSAVPDPGRDPVGEPKVRTTIEAVLKNEVANLSETEILGPATIKTGSREKDETTREKKETGDLLEMSGSRTEVLPMRSRLKVPSSTDGMPF